MQEIFYHGTSIEAAKQIEQQGLKAFPWKVKGRTGKYVWCSTVYANAKSYGETDLDGGTREKFAVVVFKWPWIKTQADPEYGAGLEAQEYRRIPHNVPIRAIIRIDYHPKER